MWELVILVVIAVIVWGFVRRYSAKVSNVNRAVPTIKLEVRASNDSRATEDFVDSGPLQQTGEREWVLNPKSPLSLRLRNATADVAGQIKAYLDDEVRGHRRWMSISFLVAKYNLVFPEVEAFVQQYAEQYLKAIQQRTIASPEWAGSSEKDRADMLSQFKEEVIDTFSVPIDRWSDVDVLFLGKPTDPAIDDEVLALFGDDFKGYQVYVTSLGKAGSVLTIRPEDYTREHWEKIARMGLARRGKDIPVTALLEGLRLKDINEMFADRMGKAIARKAKAVEFALSQLDLGERLGKIMGYRELFQPLLPADLDVSALQASYRYAEATTQVLTDTYKDGAATLMTIRDAREDQPSGWNIEYMSREESKLPACAKERCGRFATRPRTLPPFHIGCECELTYD